MTNLYPIGKTLRFALKPIGKTFKHIEQAGIIARDKQRDSDYNEIKKLFDKLHDEFITQSLQKSSIDREDFVIFYAEYKKKNKNNQELTATESKKLWDELQSRLAKLRKQITNLYEITAHEWKQKPERQDTKGNYYLKDKSYKILTESGILKVLQHEYKNTAYEEHINNFEGFFTYFSGFNQNRENYYSAEDKSTAVAYRIVDQNLLTFCNNLQLIDKIQTIGLQEQEKQIANPNFYNTCLTQEGIDSYNAILGGAINDQWERISDGINQRINQYNQQNRTKLPQLKKLYKQIGSQKAKTIPFTLIETDQELQQVLQDFMEHADKQNNTIQVLVHNIVQEQYDRDKIRLTKTALNILSQKYFANRHTIAEKGVEVGIRKEKQEDISIPKHINLGQIKEILESIETTDQLHLEEEKRTYLFKKHIENLRSSSDSHRKLFLKALQYDFSKLLSNDEHIHDETGKVYKIRGYQQSHQKLLEIIQNLHPKEHKNHIKQFADSAIAILRFIKLFSIRDEALDKDSTFYNELDHIIQDYPASKLYDAIRNYMTKKPYNEEKLKLNFDCSTLLAGWDKNKQTQNLSVLLKDRQKYYLAIMKKDNNKFFEKTKSLYTINDSENTLQKMEYKLLPGPNKMLPKCLLPGKDKKKYGATDEILRLYNNQEFKKGESFSTDSLHKLIDFYKQWLQRYEDRQVFNFTFKPTEQYQDISQFYTDVEKQGYKINRTPVNKQHLLEHVEQGDIYLFEIYSKDFSEKSSGNKNLQTIYRQNLFAPHSNLKLNGEAEVFFRPKSDIQSQEIITQKEGKKIQYTDNTPIHKQRYMDHTILFHVPITLGFGNKSRGKFNQTVNQKLINDYNNIKIIGIDRGEKHLAFYSVIDTQGKIIEQGSLNTIGWVPYEQKLADKASTRLQARQNWDIIGNIKNLKEWYISQVVRKIADLILQHNAIVVFEDLNTGFKRGRQKIEQSVYQKLELALAKKLNFLVDKQTELGQPGSATHAYQLTPPVNTFGDIKGKQRGVILYTRANYTSTTDPITGFRKNLYLKKTNKNDMKRQIKAFDEIGFDSNKQAYFFTYNPSNFKEGRGNTARTIRSCVDRFRGNKNRSTGQRENKAINPTQELDILCNTYNINKNSNILEQITQHSSLPAEFYASLIWIIDVILQVRNTGTSEQESDFIHSPVEPFFDSRPYKALQSDESENSIEKPTSWDANGAYNIARKGLLMLRRIQENPDKPDLYISDKDWDYFNLN